MLVIPFKWRNRKKLKKCPRLIFSEAKNVGCFFVTCDAARYFYAESVALTELEILVYFFKTMVRPNVRWEIGNLSESKTKTTKRHKSVGSHEQVPKYLHTIPRQAWTIKSFFFLAVINSKSLFFSLNSISAYNNSSKDVFDCM
jgi:hypothetical protein